MGANLKLREQKLLNMSVFLFQALAALAPPTLTCLSTLPVWLQDVYNRSLHHHWPPRCQGARACTLFLVACVFEKGGLVHAQVEPIIKLDSVNRSLT
jgi:hypothetical protein